VDVENALWPLRYARVDGAVGSNTFEELLNGKR
jgi:hypothetical protein